MQKQSVRLLTTVLLLGWFFDYLFYKHTPGISFTVYAVATLTGGYILLRLQNIHPARSTLLLLGGIIFFMVMTVLRAEPLSMLLSHALTLLLMAVMAVSYRGGQWWRYSLLDYFSRAWGLFVSVWTRPLFLLLGRHSSANEEDVSRKTGSHFWPVVRGVLLALPVLIFFASLLSSADLVFAARLNVLLDLFRLENIGEYLFRLIYILFLGYILAGVYLHASERSADENLPGREKPLVQPFLGFIEANIILGSVVLLFTSFVIIQFQYFFGGQANIHLDGMTYAEYARRGFGELVSVAFFVILLFLVLAGITCRETSFKKKIFSIFSLVLLVQVAIMLVSAYQRLVLYEDAYGFTRLRTYTHVFMFWVAVLLASLTILDLFQRQRSFALVALLSALGFAISLTVLNVDVFIFNQNMARFEQGQSLDVGYLASLSTDVVPSVVHVYESTGENEKKHDYLGAVLACTQYMMTQNERDTSWQAFNYSRYQAWREIEREHETLKVYRVDDSSWPVQVFTPSGEEFDCQSSMD